MYNTTTTLPSNWGIRYYVEGIGWEYFYKDNGIDILSFDTQEEARNFLNVYLNTEYLQLKQKYQDALIVYTSKKKVYNKRRKVLEQAGLWTQKNENSAPLIAPKPVKKPSYPNRDMYEIVKMNWTVYYK